MSAHRLARDFLVAPWQIADPGVNGTLLLDNKGRVFCAIKTTGAESRIIPAPQKTGQVLIVAADALAGACTLTVTGGVTGLSSLTFSAAGDFAVLVAVSVAGVVQWQVLRYVTGGLFAQPGVAVTATFSPAAGTTNVCLDTITLMDAFGNAVSTPTVFNWYLSDSAAGAGLTATTASGAVAAGASGQDNYVITSKKLTNSKTTAAGVYIASITDSAKTGFYLVVNLPNGNQVVSSQLVTGNYG